MQFNLNRYLLGLSYAIDCMESELLGVTTNHGKRVAYVALRMAHALGLPEAEIFDIAAFAILHDNGLSEEALANDRLDRDRLCQVEDLPAHCDIGERNVEMFPFQSKAVNIIRYHHEHWDGSGFFGLQGDDIPKMAQIIGLADYTDLRFRYETPDPANRERILAFLAEKSGTAFSPELVEVFRQVSDRPAFWLDLRNPFIQAALDRYMPDMTVETDWNGVLSISRVFSRIIDSKSRFTLRHSSGVEEKIACMADHYNIDGDTRIRLQIAANLHDVGKLAIPNAILDKSAPLTDIEQRRMMEHTYYTRLCLEPIPNFQDISQWASNHHEKLTGTGYPLGLTADQLDVYSRLLSVLDIYQALSEERPYHRPLPHSQVMQILDRQCAAGELDPDIVNEVRYVFA